MARLIQKSGYIQGGRAARYMEYVAKRDGVEVIQRLKNRCSSSQSC